MGNSLGICLCISLWDICSLWDSTLKWNGQSSLCYFETSPGHIKEWKGSWLIEMLSLWSPSDLPS